MCKSTVDILPNPRQNVNINISAWAYNACSFWAAAASSR